MPITHGYGGGGGGANHREIASTLHILKIFEHFV